MQPTVVVGADWTLHPCNVGVTLQARRDTTEVKTYLLAISPSFGQQLSMRAKSGQQH